MAQAVDYSNLEVGQSPHTPKEAYSTLQVQKSKEEYSTLQVQRPKEKYSSLPQVNAPDLSAWDTKKELSRPYDPYDASAPEKVGEYADPDPPFSSKRNRTICGLRRRIFWITIALSVLVIAAIIGGAVGGTVSKHARKHVHSTSSTLLANTSDVPSASQLLNSTSLSAVAWNDTTQTLQQRLYIQASDSNIWELSWNSAVQRWFTSSKAIAKAKPGSPLAAAVAYKGRTNQLNLYFINDGGQLMQMNTTDYQTWDTNPVRTSTGTIAKPANDSSLAATWYKYTVCADCSYNAFVAYQDSDNGTFRVVNSSTSGDVQHVAIPGHPVSGSACTFDLEWRSTTRANIRLGYQMGSGQIASAAWNGTINSWHASESDTQTSTYSITALRAPLTSFNYGRGAPTNVPDYLFVLSAGDNGVAVNWWDNSDPDSTHWGSPQSPDVMQGVRSLSPIAANAVGHVFAFEDGVVKEFEVGKDGTTWTVVGDVTKS